MKHTKPFLTIALALTTSLAFAQPPPPKAGGPNKPPQNDQNPNDPPDKPPGDGKHHPKSLLLEALDTDHDGIISAEEIANAPQSLKKLDKNGDGKITPDELHPPRPKDGPPPDGNNAAPKKRKPPVQAQGQDQNPPPAGPKDPPDGPKGPRDQNDPPHGPPHSPLMAALDTDKDGTLSADEIANASESLKKLDKNGDGKLTPDEYRPAPRDGDKGPKDDNKGPRDGDKNQPKPVVQDGNDANVKKRPQAE
jgi:hypothetical protein